MGKPVILVENFRALFYAPFYLTQATGSYAAEGVTVELQASPSPADSGRRLAAGTVDVMWGGPLRVLLDHDADRGSESRVFHATVCRDPFFLIGAQPAPGFTMRDLVPLRFAAVSEVPTPWICLAHDLRLAGIDPATVIHAAPATMAENADRLRRGALDVVQLFQPYAEQLLQDGTGHLWLASATRGPTAYTTLVARTRTLDTRREEMAGMGRAIARTLRWIAATPGTEIAPHLAPWFPDLPRAMLAACLDRYKAHHLWNDDPALLRQGFDWLRAAMLAQGTIAHGASYEACVDLGLV